MNTQLFVYAPELATSSACRNLVAALTKRFGLGSVTIVSANNAKPTLNARSALIVVQSGWQLTSVAPVSSAFRSDELRNLLAYALQHGQLVIPVLVGNSKLAEAIDLPPALDYLSSQQNFDIREGSSFGRDVKRLCQHIEEQFGRPVYTWLLWLTGLALVSGFILGPLLVYILLLVIGPFVEFESIIACLLLCAPGSVVSLVAAIHAASEQRVRWFVSFLIASVLSLLVPFISGTMLAIAVEFNSFDLVPFLVLSLGFVLIGQLALLVPYSIGKRRLTIRGLRRGKQLPRGIALADLPLPIPNIAFISYRRSDTREMCNRIFSYLNRRFRNRRVFRDINSILAGAQFEAVLQRAVSGSKVLLALIGPTWLTAKDSRGVRRLDDPGDFVRAEIRIALELGKSVVPVLIGGATMPPAQELPADIAALSELSPMIVRADSHFNSDMNRIARLIRQHVRQFNLLGYTLLMYLVLLVAIALYGFWTLGSTTASIIYSIENCGGHLCGTPQPDPGVVIVMAGLFILRVFILIIYGASAVSIVRAKRYERLVSLSAAAAFSVVIVMYLVILPLTDSQIFNMWVAITAFFALLVTDGFVLTQAILVVSGALAVQGRFPLHLEGNSQFFQDPFARIQVLMKLEQYEDVVAACDAGIRVLPELAPLYGCKSMALALLERYDEALANCAIAIRLDPSQALGFQSKGYALLGLKRYEEALVALNEAIHLDPNVALSHQFQGIVLNVLERYEEALDTSEKAIQLDPVDDGAYQVRAIALEGLGRYEEALASCETAIRLNPSDADTYQFKASALYQLGRFDEALADCETAIRLNPTDADGFQAKGLVLHELERYDEALAAYDEAIFLDPTDVDTPEYRNETLHALGR